MPRFEQISPFRPEGFGPEEEIKKATESLDIIELQKERAKAIEANRKAETEAQKQAREILDNLKELIETEKLARAQELLEAQIEEGAYALQEIKKETAEYVVDNPKSIDKSRDAVGSIIGFLHKVLGSKVAGKAAKIALGLGILYGAKETVGPTLPVEAAIRHPRIEDIEKDIEEAFLSDEEVEVRLRFYNAEANELDKRYKEKNPDFMMEWSPLFFMVDWKLHSSLNASQEEKFGFRFGKLSEKLIDVYYAKTLGKETLDLDKKIEVEKFKNLEEFGNVIYQISPLESKKNALDLEIILLGQQHGGPDDYASSHSQENIYNALNELIKTNNYKFIGTEKQEATVEQIQKHANTLKELSKKSSLTHQERVLKGNLEKILFLAPVKIRAEMGSQIIMENVDPEYETKEWREEHKKMHALTARFFSTLYSFYAKIELFGGPNFPQAEKHISALNALEEQYSEEVIKVLDKRGRQALDKSLEEIIRAGETKGAVVFGLGDALFFKSEAETLNQDASKIVQKIKEELGENYFKEKYGKDVEDINLNFYIFNPRIPEPGH